MEANLRILQSFKKVNEKIEANEKKQKEINEKNDEFLKDISKEIKELDSENEDLKKELAETIEKVKQEKPKDGKDGKNGRDGKDGYTPIKNIDYFDGNDGKDGRDGLDGKNGKDGVDGKDGQDGLDGISVYDAEINEKGELILKLTNGKKINCGVVKGKDGIGFNGVGISKVEIIDGHLIVTLTTGKTIDAGLISGGIGEETDPTVPKHVKNITEEDIKNWNNHFSGDYEDLENIPNDLVQDANYIHTDNNFTDDDKEKLDGLENFSGSSADVDYLDSDVESTLTNIIDSVGSLDNLETEDTSNIVNAINELASKGTIKEIHNGAIDLLTFPPGIYYLTGKYTMIKYTSTLVTQNIITSDKQKAVLISFDAYNTYGRAVVFSGVGTSSQTFLHVFGSGSYNNYNLNGLITTTLARTITGQWTFNTLPKTSKIPTTTTHLTNKSYVDNRFYEVKYATNLGYIDLDDYDGDVFAFMNTIKDEGRYRFVDSYDDFEWYVEVYRTDYYAGQVYWSNEEGFLNRYYRYGIYNEDEDIVEWDEWNNYLDYTTANSLFKRKTDVDYVTISVADLRTWLDEMKSFATREYDVIQTSNGHKFMVSVRYTSSTISGQTRRIRYQEYYDIEEPDKIYKRTGTSNNDTINQVVTWGSWYVFEGIAEQ